MQVAKFARRHRRHGSVSREASGNRRQWAQSRAQEAADKLRGKATIDVKNEVALRALEYAQTHGAETIKALGLAPNGGQAIEAIKARIEAAIADPATPTPAVVANPIAHPTA